MLSSNKTSLKIFVPFINEPMVDRFFRKNPHLVGIELALVDNRERNAGLPTLYNEAIEEHIYQDMWLFFVHEDFEILGPFYNLSNLTRNAVYGTFGVRLKGHDPVGIGRHICSRKDGSKPVEVGEIVEHPTWVDTIDCQSILLHTSLLRNLKRLRFDEKLSFDLYCEEFCLNAQENFGIPVLIMPLVFQHYSHGKITERYHQGLEHLARRYPNSAMPGTCSFLGGRASDLAAHFTYDIEANR